MQNHPFRLAVVALAAILLVPFVPSTVANDAGSGGDAGNTFDTATEVTPLGLYHAVLQGGSDAHDYYRFFVSLGDSINIEIRDVLQGGSLLANDNGARMSFRLLSPQGVLLDTPNTNQGDTRVMLSVAPAEGWYRFLVTLQNGGFTGPYAFCFLRPPDEPHPCPDIGMRPQQVIFGGTLPGAQRTRVLVVPPSHGDLGNPLGPTVFDYLDATLSGIHEWVRVLHEFADLYPQYAYLKQVTVEVAVFDGLQTWTDYDIVIVFSPTGGTQFRGLASSCLQPPRCVVLSLFSMAPRSGQILPDYPEYNDLEAVVKHEFAHVWGLGHTLSWSVEHGPDLMNSPATFQYGDGSPVGDGGERTEKKCISTLNLYGMALLFRHINGQPKVTGGSFQLPGTIPYDVVC